MSTVNSSRKFPSTNSLLVWALFSSILILLSFIEGLTWLAPLGGLLSIGYAIILSRYLTKRGQLYSVVKEVIPPFIILKNKFWRLISLLILCVILIFTFGLMVGPAVGLLLVLNLISLTFIKKWLSKINQKIILFASVLSFVVSLSIIFLGTHDFSWAIFMGVTTFNLSISGSLLQYEIQLTKIHILESNFLQSLKSFMWGCIFSLPLALLNILGEIYKEDTYITYWWQSFYAFSVGIGEEIWARLFLLSLLYIIVLPSTDNNPRRAILVAIIFSSLIHGFAHSGI
ncbi:MAG: hypothetical protein ACFFAE_12170, partial [Candidatus Hodarchaeota archaeon]